MILLTVPCKLSLVVFLKTLGNVLFMMQLSKCNVPLSLFLLHMPIGLFLLGKLDLLPCHMAKMSSLLKYAFLLSSNNKFIKVQFYLTLNMT